MVGGKTVNYLKGNPYSTASQLLIDYLYAYYNADSSQAAFLAANNLALSARLFRELGGFNPALRIAAEDREFCDRWRHQGFSAIYAPEVIVQHAHHLSLASFWKQHFRYGRGAYLFRQVRISRGQPRIRREPLLFYLDLLMYPFRQGYGQRSFLLALLLMGSQVANLLGFMWEREKRKHAGSDWQWRRRGTA
jgi:GT2 family glycosyltransferase